jgi:proteasome lid subunit RPN8/RPN11
MKSIIEHAEKSNLEVCGFITVEDGELKVQPAQNIANYSDDIFEIHPLEILRQIRSGKLAAIYHTHPATGEEESKFDKFNCENSCIPYVIYSKQSQKFNLLVPKKPHVKSEFIEILRKQYD